MSLGSKQEPPREVFTFAQVCDPQLGMGGYEHDRKSFAQAIRQLNALKPDFAIICGDLVDRPDPTSIADIKQLLSTLEVPWYCIPGNHDVLHESYDQEVGQDQHLSLTSYRQAFGKDYYTFEYNAHRFICVNSQLWFYHVPGETERQDRWLTQVLQASQSNHQPTILISHHPLYLTSPEEDDQYYNLPRTKRLEILSLLETHGVLAVLSGHTHQLVIPTHPTLQLVSGEATSVNLHSPLGFRLWTIKGTPPFEHHLVPLDFNGQHEQHTWSEGRFFSNMFPPEKNP